jgi:CheY-like chemotaxis protein
MTTILLIEDNDMNRDMLCRRLKRRGYSIITALDGGDGLVAAQEKLPDIILLDMSLPTMDGWEVARLIRMDTSTAALPIIGLSAHAMAGDRQKALEAGCNDYESKPIDFDSLIRKIEYLTVGTEGEQQT